MSAPLSPEARHRLTYVLITAALCALFAIGGLLGILT